MGWGRQPEPPRPGLIRSHRIPAPAIKRASTLHLEWRQFDLDFCFLKQKKTKNKKSSNSCLKWGDPKSAVFDYWIWQLEKEGQKNMPEKLKIVKLKTEHINFPKAWNIWKANKMALKY